MEIYDLLVEMQKNYDNAACVADCVITWIVGEIANFDRRDYCDHVCSLCIAEWLNEEAKL